MPKAMQREMAMTGWMAISGMGASIKGQSAESQAGYAGQGQDAVAGEFDLEDHKRGRGE